MHCVGAMAGAAVALALTSATNAAGTIIVLKMPILSLPERRNYCDPSSMMAKVLAHNPNAITLMIYSGVTNANSYSLCSDIHCSTTGAMRPRHFEPLKIP
jgi:hypothetical protein